MMIGFSTLGPLFEGRLIADQLKDHLEVLALDPFVTRHACALAIVLKPGAAAML